MALRRSCLLLELNVALAREAARPVSRTERTMNRLTVTTVAASVALLMAAPGLAQTTRIEQIEQAKSEKATQAQPPERERGDLVITKAENFFMPAPPAARLTFGDFRPGAGFALGATYGVPVGERGLWTSRGALSLNRFKELETTLDVPPLTTDRVRVRGTARWEDAPDLRFFGLGMNASPDAEVAYGLRSTEAGGDVRVQGPRHFGYGGTLQYLRTESGEGAGDVPVVGDQSLSEWLHSGVYVEFDTRHSPGYTTTGGLYRVTVHDYIGHSAVPSFRRTEVDLRSSPSSTATGSWPSPELTDASANGEEVPFFMLPYIGAAINCGIRELPIHRPERAPAERELRGRHHPSWIGCVPGRGYRRGQRRRVGRPDLQIAGVSARASTVQPTPRFASRSPTASKAGAKTSPRVVSF